LVYRCLLTQGVMIGSEDDIWKGAPSSAFRALATLRLCISAIGDLTEGRHTVRAGFVKAVVMQTNGLSDSPYCLDEMAEFLMEDAEARSYWDSVMLDDRFPVRCPICKTAAAFVGINSVECKAKCVASSSRF
jgi:hypothetical protein